jgi:hypothetical protein
MIKNLKHIYLSFSRVLGTNSKSPSLKSTKRKEKNINKCSYTIKKAPPPSIYLFQEFRAPIPNLQV